MRTRAFSLIELLVTLAIITVLAALIMPAVSSAKSQGLAAQCMSNLRQLATANLAYAADHSGQYAPAQEPKNRTRWHGERTSLSAPFDRTKGYLAPYLGREGRVKACPVFIDALKGRDTFEMGTGGYGYNAIYIGGTPQSTYTPARMSGVPNPARTVMFADTAFPRDNGLQEYPYAEPFQAVDENGTLVGALDPSVHFRHNGKAHVAWCDGHVTAESPTRLGGRNLYGGTGDTYQIGWFGPEPDNGYWRP